MYSIFLLTKIKVNVLREDKYYDFEIVVSTVIIAIANGSKIVNKIGTEIKGTTDIF